MAEFSYIAATRDGKKIEGTLASPSEGELRMTLRGQGLRPITISRVGVANTDVMGAIRGLLGTSNSVPSARLLNFIRQLHVMITSGVPMVQAIELFHDQEPEGSLKRILGNAKEKIKSGSFLWESFAAYPDVFERVFVSLIRAGESSGTLDVMLKRVGKYLENSYRLQKLIKSSMTYPIAVLAISFGVVTLMLTMVIPKFEEMIKGSGGVMPAPTAFVIAMSHFVTGNFIPIIVVSGSIAFLFRMYIRTPEGRIVFQKVLMSLPLFGQLILKSGVARFSRTLSTLLASGVPMVDSLEICKNSATHVAFQDAIGTIKKEVELGSSVANAMQRQKIFPKMATQMTSVGENTGNMDKMLEKVADFYEEEVESAVQGLLRLIEPFMLVFLGGIVGGLMIAMYLPIFQMAGSQG
jgi:type IV pilus assembly protein PilC